MATGRVSVRLDGDLLRQVEEYARSSGISTPSAAIRVLLRIGLDRSTELTETYKLAVAAEASRFAYAAIETAIGEAFARLRKPPR